MVCYFFCSCIFNNIIKILFTLKYYPNNNWFLFSQTIFVDKNFILTIDCIAYRIIYNHTNTNDKFIIRIRDRISNDCWANSNTELNLTEYVCYWMSKTECYTNLKCTQIWDVSIGVDKKYSGELERCCHSPSAGVTWHPEELSDSSQM